MLRATCLLLLLITAPALHANARPDTGPDWRPVERAAEDLVPRGGRGGVAVIAIADGEIVWRTAHGYADRAERRRLRTATPLPIGSLGELHLGALALRLAQQGRIDLDESLSAYLPGLTIDLRELGGEPPHLRQVLSHHAGLAGAPLRGLFHPIDAPVAPFDPTRGLYALFPFGQVYLRSSSAIELAARALERRGGADFATLIEREVTAPLGLPTPTYGVVAGRATLYRKGDPQPPLVARERAARGMTASPDDLARLVAALLADRRGDAWLTAEARAHFFRAQNREAFPDLGIESGFGFRLQRDSRPGVGSVARLDSGFPASQIGVRVAVDHRVAVLAAANFEDDADEFEDLLDTALDVLLRQRLTALAERPKKPALPARLPLPSDLRPDDSAPRYATFSGLAEAPPRGAPLTLDIAGWRFLGQPRADGWYRPRLEVLGAIPIGFGFLDRIAVRPARVGDARLLLLADASGEVFPFGVALDPAAADPDAARYAGRYRLINADRMAEEFEIDEVELRYADGLLRVRIDPPGLVPVKPEMPLLREHGELFRMPGFGIGLGPRLRFFREGGRQRFEFSGYVLERL